jgi:hypothetical protein
VAVVKTWLAAAALATGCAAELDAPEPAPALDVDAFRCTVQPVIAARCAFAECHASARRPFRTYAVGRMRYAVGWDRLEEPLTETELTANYEAARNFALGAEPLLLYKPLDARAGGYYHRGADLYGEDDVFVTADDPGYRAIADWIAGGDAPAGCTEITEVGP